MSDWERFKQYSALADQLIEAASKEQIAEAARLLALNAAHLTAWAGPAPTEDLTAMLRAKQINPESAAMLANGMESLVGVLGRVMGLDQPDKMN